MIDDPLQMMRGLIVLAPEMNMKVALLNLIDYVDEVMYSLDEDHEVEQIRIEDLLEVVAESLVKLHHHVGDDDVDDTPNNVVDINSSKSYDDVKPLTVEEIETFKQMFGIVSDEEQEEKE